MTRFMRWLRNLAEKWLGRYYEGEKAPERLAQMVMTFANENPHATRAEWVLFASEMAEESYRSGFTRGVEYVERDPTFFDDLDPDGVMSAHEPDWKWSDAISLEGNPEDIPSPEEFGDPVEDVLIDLEREGKPHEFYDGRPNPFLGE